MSRKPRTALQRHERVECTVAGNAVMAATFIEQGWTGRIIDLHPETNEARVQFDRLNVTVMIPLSHLKTEGHVEGHRD